MASGVGLIASDRSNLSTASPERLVVFSRLIDDNATQAAQHGGNP